MGIAKRRKEEIALLKNESKAVKSFVDYFVSARNKVAHTKTIVVNVQYVGNMRANACIKNAHHVTNNSNGEMGPAFGWIISKHRISGQIEIIPHVFNMHYESGKFYEFTAMPYAAFYSEKTYVLDFDMFDYVFANQSKTLVSDLPRHCYFENNVVYSVLDLDQITGKPKKERVLDKFSIDDFDWHWRDGREYKRYNECESISETCTDYMNRAASNDNQFTKVA